MSDNSNGIGGTSVSVANRLYTASVANRLFTVFRSGNLENLREMLSQQQQQQQQNNQDEGRRGGGAVFVVSDNDILAVLRMAGPCLDENVEGCRLLWTRLSPNEKQKYFAETTNAIMGLLHMAVSNGHLEVVRLFVEECNFNVNQTNSYGVTPLYFAAVTPEYDAADGITVEMSRLLLDAGADPNRGLRYGPLYNAVKQNDTQVVRLLLQRGANPNLNRRPSYEENVVDIAIRKGNMEILLMLLQHGALVDASNRFQSLNNLLRDRSKNREIKLTISHLLVEHAERDQATTAFMQHTLEIAINKAENGSCEILLEAGMDPLSAMYITIQGGKISLCQLLMREYHIDPFLATAVENEDTDETAASSPFLAAARQADTSIFEYFLNLWTERFASSEGKNSDGNYPIHVICCDPHVSIQAIQLVVEEFQANISQPDHRHGLLPFRSAVLAGASIDVMNYLLNRHPDALLSREQQQPTETVVAVAMDNAVEEEQGALHQQQQPEGNLLLGLQQDAAILYAEDDAGLPAEEEEHDVQEEAPSNAPPSKKLKTSSSSN